MKSPLPAACRSTGYHLVSGMAGCPMAGHSHSSWCGPLSACGTLSYPPGAWESPWASEQEYGWARNQLGVGEPGEGKTKFLLIATDRKRRRHQIQNIAWSCSLHFICLGICVLLHTTDPMFPAIQTHPETLYLHLSCTANVSEESSLPLLRAAITNYEISKD